MNRQRTIWYDAYGARCIANFFSTEKKSRHEILMNLVNERIAAVSLIALL